MTLISLFGLWTGDNQYCQDNCEENADFSDLNVKAMEVNGRFYVGKNNSLDCRIWSSKNPKKLHMRQRRASIINLGRRKVSVQPTGFFSSLFLAGLTSFMWPCQFLLHVYFVRARPSFAGAHGPLRNKHAKKKLARPHKGSLAGQKKWKNPVSCTENFLLPRFSWSRLSFGA